MPKAAIGDTVKVHYTGTLEDEQVFDSSEGRDPLEFTLGSGEVIPGFEEAVVGMSPGDEKEATLDPDEAYGKRREDLVFSVGRDQLPDELEPERGQRLEMRQGDQTFPVVITGVSDSEVELDANHPLAGRELTFRIELVEID